VARSTAPFIGRTGLPHMSGALGTGIFAGYVFVIPGLAAVSIAGLLEIPLGTWLLYGLVLGPLTAIVTTLIFRLLLRSPYWNPTKDEDVDPAMVEQESTELVNDDTATPPLFVCLLPILVPLVLIAFGAFAELLEFSNEFIAFLGDANLALFVGLLGAYLLCRRTLGSDGTDAAMSEGFHTTGAILLITGIGGSLGAVIGETGLDKILADLFTADEAAPVTLSILLAWLIAAVLHLAIGSVSVAAITAAGIIGPVLASINVSPVVIGLAIASGAMFALQVNSNFFWMYKSLLGLSTQGTFKTLTVVTSIASVVSLPMVMAVALIA
jgi:gluconate:H+ symporter, GntP family